MIILIAIVKSQLDLHEQLFLKHEAFDFFLGNPHGKFCISENAIEVDLELT